MTVEKVIDIFHKDFENWKVYKISKIDDEYVIITCPEGYDVNNWCDGFFSVKEGENKAYPWSPLFEEGMMQKFKKAFEKPLYSSEDDSLSHYGVKGMKWGVINEDPLLGRFANMLKKPVEMASRLSTYSSENLQKLTTYVKDTIKNDVVKPKINQMRQQLKPVVDPYKDAFKYIVDTEPTVNSIYRQLSGKKRDKSQDIVLNLKKVIDIGNAANRNKAMSKTYELGENYGYNTNCPNCALATELAKRGINVTPAPMVGGLSSYFIKTVYKGETSETYDENNIKEKFDKLSKKIGSHGVINGFYHEGGGHIFNYTILQDGTVQFEDAQIGTIYKGVDEMMQYYNFKDGYIQDLTDADIDIDMAEKMGMFKKPTNDVDAKKLEDFRKNNRSMIDHILARAKSFTEKHPIIKDSRFDEFIQKIEDKLDDAKYAAGLIDTNDLFENGYSKEDLSRINQMLNISSFYNYKTTEGKSYKQVRKEFVDRKINEAISNLERLTYNDVKKYVIQNEGAGEDWLKKGQYHKAIIDEKEFEELKEAAIRSLKLRQKRGVQ